MNLGSSRGWTARGGWTISPGMNPRLLIAGLVAAALVALSCGVGPEDEVSPAPVQSRQDELLLNPGGSTGTTLDSSSAKGKDGGSRNDYLIIKFEDVIISG